MFMAYPPLEIVLILGYPMKKSNRPGKIGAVLAKEDQEP
jgi:hypothetical protein